MEDDITEINRRFTCLYTQSEWARIEQRVLELQRVDPRVTYSDVVRELARSLPGPDESATV